jgi:hypothetical protein
MSSIYNKLNSAILSSLVEVCVTHPIDYYKTLKQKGIRNSFEIWRVYPYKGVVTRFIGVVPMRGLYWSSIEYMRENRYPNYVIPFLTSTIQMTVDYPIEQMKINKMMGRRAFHMPSGMNIMSGFTSHYIRNILFTYGFFYGDLFFGSPFVGGIIGSLISHPFDTLKTFYQSENRIDRLTFDILYRGSFYRTVISMLSLGVGWSVYRSVQDMQKSLFDK